MKGTVAVCLKEMVHKLADEAAWRRILEGAGFDAYTIFTTGEDIPDDKITDLMTSTCEVLGRDLQNVFDEFGEYWMLEYGPKLYIAFYDGKKNSREFLETMDNVHIVVTNTMVNSQPPRFQCEWTNDRTMVMHYDSHRGLVDLMISFIKGVGKYYEEDLGITRLGDDRVEIVFPA